VNGAGAFAALTNIPEPTCAGMASIIGIAAGLRRCQRGAQR